MLKVGQKFCLRDTYIGIGLMNPPCPLCDTLGMATGKPKVEVRFGCGFVCTADSILDSQKTLVSGPGFTHIVYLVGAECPGPYLAVPRVTIHDPLTPTISIDPQTGKFVSNQPVPYSMSSRVAPGVLHKCICPKQVLFAQGCQCGGI